MTVKSELEELFQTDELLRVHEIVDWAKGHPTSSLYHELKCDDDEAAASLWRLHHARQLIAIHLIDSESYRQTVSLSVDRASEGGYRMLESILTNQDLYQIALNDALADLERMHAKYQHLKELEPVWKEVRRARKPKGAESRATP